MVVRLLCSLCLAPPGNNQASGTLEQAGDEGGVSGLATDTGETPRHLGQGLQGEAAGGEIQSSLTETTESLHGHSLDTAPPHWVSKKSRRVRRFQNSSYKISVTVTKREFTALPLTEKSVSALPPTDSESLCGLRNVLVWPPPYLATGKPLTHLGSNALAASARSSHTNSRHRRVKASSSARAALSAAASAAAPSAPP